MTGAVNFAGVKFHLCASSEYLICFSIIKSKSGIHGKQGASLRMIGNFPFL